PLRSEITDSPVSFGSTHYHDIGQLGLRCEPDTTTVMPNQVSRCLIANVVVQRPAQVGGLWQSVCPGEGAERCVHQALAEGSRTGVENRPSNRTIVRTVANWWAI